MELYAGSEKAATPYKTTVAHILRLGHIVIGVKRFDETARWLMDDFGFKASDYVIGMFAFLRCWPDPYHHSLGLEAADVNKLHHIAFMVKDINDIGIAANRLRKAGAKVVFGPGRHVASLSIFLYFLDPDGMTIEYTTVWRIRQETRRAMRYQLVPSLETVDMGRRAGRRIRQARADRGTGV
jgi:2,3-dihydroxy-p-cumate/2,3-dihydroxybenzoate 3,4-dioxygenase